jgi:antibiotic biosynthesis monooxygenase (ABM) superfamily enzyme
MAVEKQSNEAEGPLTLIVTWRVRKGQEKAFAEWPHEVTEAATAFPGHMGVNVIRTSGAGQEFVVVFRFDTYAHLRAWQASDIHLELMRKAEPLREKDPRTVWRAGWSSGLPIPARPPPRAGRWP